MPSKAKANALVPLPKGRSRDNRNREPRPDDPLTWPQRWALAFKRFQKDGHIRNEREGGVLRALLRRAGHRVLSDDLTDQVVAKVSKFTLLHSSEVFNILQFYEGEVVQQLENAFLRRAYYGMLSADHLQTILFEVGYGALLQDSLHEVLEEAVLALKCDPPSSGAIDMTIFMKIMELLADRSGFSKSEHQGLLRVWKSFDSDGSGFNETIEMPPVIVWFSFCANAKAVTDILEAESAELKQAAENELEHTPETSLSSRPNSEDLSGSIDFEAFLNTVRRHRIEVYARSKPWFEELDTNLDGKLTVIEVFRLVQRFGMHVTPQALFEAMTVLNLQDSFSFSDFWKVMEMLRQSDGLHRELLAEVRAAFKKFDEGGRGQIRTRQVLPALQWLGLMLGLSMNSTGRSTWKARYGQRGCVCEAEFIRIAREFFEAEFRLVRSAYRGCAAANGAGLLSSGQLQLALKQVNISFPQYCEKWLLKSNMPSSWLDSQDAGLDIEEFRQVVEGCRASVRERFQVHSGFMWKEVQEIQYKFTKLGPEKDEKLPQKKVMELLTFLVPAATRPELRDMMKEALRAHNCATQPLSMLSFLAVMRTFQDMAQAREDEAAPAVASELLLPRIDDVDDFLDIFHSVFCIGGIRNLTDSQLRFLYQAGRKDEKGLQLPDDGLSIAQVAGLGIVLEELIERENSSSNVEQFIKTVKELRSYDLKRLESREGHRRVSAEGKLVSSMGKYVKSA
mmetsp:Transcript_5966/g.9522  ORF Transcript_5966/g.9522 Transcript_5966/m.9522 type:complete len:735 (-) Transcript_5966:92-2296(-)